MVFKKMLSAFGVGGPSVDTVLTNPNTRPGLVLDGQVNLRGGDSAADIEQVTVALVTRVEMEAGDSEYAGTMEFYRLPVSGAMRLEAKQELAIPFQLPVPWETPITDVYGQRLRGMTMGLRTELAIARAVDKGDLDAIAVHPLPVHEKILEAFAQLGFQFKSADLERGQIYGVQQTLPFYQEIEFFAAPQYAHAIREVELTFVTNQHGVDVIIECDKRGGMFSGGHDSVGRYTAEHAGVDQVDWRQRVEGWLAQTVQSYGRHGGAGQHYGHPGKQGHHGGHGMGGMVAGAALGLAGGMIAGEMLEDAFEGDFGEE
ncbi:MULTISPECIES: sporulation protein [unclassified Plantactinospora]|uniref:sporulation protein n=1 Tax=unclassified Plantactinospora TaxID=2631981 RepID=UPI000D16E828|nr:MULTISPECIES: sporulation protein [unclassified Plantactinospora]AVT32783.1 SpoOM family protein [Plantactinospora sp. BC1]AVT37996.1 SpoOM family protein [Plantactinospora sp. BB1]